MGLSNICTLHIVLSVLVGLALLAALLTIMLTGGEPPKVKCWQCKNGTCMYAGMYTMCDARAGLYSTSNCGGVTCPSLLKHDMTMVTATMADVADEVGQVRCALVPGDPDGRTMCVLPEKYSGNIDTTGCDACTLCPIRMVVNGREQVVYVGR